MSNAMESDISGDAPEQENGYVQKENTGRWSTTEHDLFLQGLSKYGKDWKAIAAGIPTRNVVQVRTHAQKYFQKITSTATIRPGPQINRRRINEIGNNASRMHQTKFVNDSEKESSEGSQPISPVVSDPSSSDKPSVITSVSVSVPVINTPRTPRAPYSPRSPRPSYFDYYDHYDQEMTAFGGSYQSAFDGECNNNQDDMKFVGSDDL